MTIKTEEEREAQLRDLHARVEAATLRHKAALRHQRLQDAERNTAQIRDDAAQLKNSARQLREQERRKGNRWLCRIL